MTNIFFFFTKHKINSLFEEFQIVRPNLAKRKNDKSFKKCFKQFGAQSILGQNLPKNLPRALRQRNQRITCF